MQTQAPVSPLKTATLSSADPVVGQGWDFEYATTREEFPVAKSSAGFLYLTRPPALSEMERIYPSNYYAYSDSTSEPPLVKKVRGFLEAKKVKHYQALIGSRAARVLDIGCGDGRLLNILRNHGPKVWQFSGIEISEAGAKAASAKDFDIIHGNFETADLARWNAQFDLALMHQLIEHLHHPAVALQSMRGVLKPGGILSIETPDTKAWDFALFKKRYWGGYHFPRHFFIFDKKSIRQLAEENGFEVIAITSILSPVFWIHSLHNACADRPRLAKYCKYLKPNNVVLLAIATTIEMIQTKLFRQSSNMQCLLRRVG